MSNENKKNGKIKGFEIGAAYVDGCGIVAVSQKDGKIKGHALALHYLKGNRAGIEPFAEILRKYAAGQKIMGTEFNAYTRVYDNREKALRVCVKFAETYDIGILKREADEIRDLPEPEKGEKVDAEGTGKRSTLVERLVKVCKKSTDNEVLAAVGEILQSLKLYETNIVLQECADHLLKLAELAK